MLNLNFPRMLSPDDPALIDQYHYITTDTHARMVADVLKKESVLGIDTETRGLNPKEDDIILFQIGNPNGMYVVDASKVDIRIFKDLLLDPSKLKILQNAVFDYKMLKHQYNLDIVNIYDTQLAELVLTCGLYDKDARKKASLLNLSKKWLNVDLNKAIRMDFTKLPKGFNLKSRPDLLLYAALDVYYPIYIYLKQREVLINEELVRGAKFEFECIPSQAHLELGGVTIDTDKWKLLISAIEEQRYLLQSKILKIINKRTPQRVLWEDAPGINIDSQVQLVRQLRKMGYPVTNTKHRTFMELQGDPLIDLLIKYRKFHKLLKAFGQTILNKIAPDGRLYTNFNQLGAPMTSRQSSSNPNLQQIPNTDFDLPGGKGKGRIRDCFIATPGHKFVLGDYSQQEVRVAGHIFKEPILYANYLADKDLYRTTASLVLDVPYDDIDKNSMERKLFKVIVLASNYGGGPNVIIGQLLESGVTISFDEAREQLKAYRELFTTMNTNMEKLVKISRSRGYVQFALGKKRYLRHMLSQLKKIEDKQSKEYRKLKQRIERIIKNTPVQGTAAVMTKAAVRYIYEEIVKNNWDAKIVLVVHDEIVLEVKDDPVLIEIVGKALKDCMERAFDEFCHGFPNKVDIKVVDKWEKE